MESFRGLETQVLRVKPSARLSRSWNSGPESQTQCPFIEVLKPRSWEPNAATRACRHGRIVSDRHGYPLVHSNLHLNTLALLFWWFSFLILSHVLCLKLNCHIYISWNGVSHWSPYASILNSGDDIADSNGGCPMFKKYRWWALQSGSFKAK